MAKKGLMIQDEKGNLYFLRPEVLAAAKVEKALYEDAQTALKAAKKAGTATPKLKVVGALNLVTAPGGAKAARKQATASPLALRGAAVISRPVGIKGDGGTSTIMCPW